MAASQALSPKMFASLRLFLRQSATVTAFSHTSKLPIIVNQKPKIADNRTDLGFFGRETWPAFHHHQQFAVLQPDDLKCRKPDSDDDDDLDYKDEDVYLSDDDDSDNVVSDDDLSDSGSD